MKNSKSKGKFIWYIVFQMLFLLLLILTFSFQWASANYGSIGMDEILFTLNMPLKGTSDSLYLSYMEDALVLALFIFVVEMIFTWPRNKVNTLVFRYNNPRKNENIRMFRLQMFPLYIKKRFVVSAVCVWIGALFVAGEKSFGLIDFCKNQLAQSKLIEEEFADPDDVKIVFPEEKRNLIYIFVESGESSNQDRANGGLFDVNYIPEMTALAENNVSFSQSDGFEGAAVAPASGWTMAGLVAETAGLPLKLFKTDESGVIDNSMSKYDAFLPGAVTLGDILEEAGYRNYFMAGSDFVFGGRESYFTQHGDYEIWDYFTAVEEGKISSDYYVWWGLRI